MEKLLETAPVLPGFYLKTQGGFKQFEEACLSELLAL
jgi:hypothetical protein